MIRYETLLLARTEITNEETSMIESQLDRLVSDAKGKLNLFDKWGKYRLAYPVNKSTNGVYMLARYEIPYEQTKNIIQEFDRFLKIKCNEVIMRHVNIRLDKDAPTTYIKPDPIEVSRRGSFDSFFKENKIENLLNSVESSADRKSGSEVDFDDEHDA